MDYLRINFLRIFFSLASISQLVSGLTNEAPCDHYELLACGDKTKSWDGCEPRTANVIRILSAQLDIRYETRNCRRYGTSHNFGLTFNGRALWTVNGCYGSFFLCLEIESSERNDIQGDYFQNKEYSLVDSDFDYDDGDEAEEGDKDDIYGDYGTSTQAVVQTESVNVVFDNDTITVSILKNHTKESKTEPTNFYYMQHERSSIKYLLMGGIITGGVIIVLLIAVMAYLCSCSDSQDKDDEQNKTKDSGSSSKYFRQKKWSIAPLISELSRTGSLKSSTVPGSPISITDNYKDVYDFIPADMKNNTIDTKEQDKSEIQVKPQASLRIENEADDKVTSHEYFVLIPETKAETDKKEVKTDIEVENEYDHLIHNPKHTIVDASTYNHINIKTGTVDGEVVNID